MAKKLFTGDVPFDYFGNLIEKCWSHRTHYLTNDNFANGNLLLNVWDHSQNKWVMKVVDNPPADFEIKYINPPNVHRPNVIAEIPYCLYLPNYIFQDKLEYVATSRSRYSVGFSFKSILTNRTYPMFMKDFDEAAPKMNFGILEGSFTFAKRGPSHAIKLI